MDFIRVAGYKELLGEPTETYEQLLQDIPSYAVILVAMGINSELTSMESDDTIQSKLVWAFTESLPILEANKLAVGLLKFKNSLLPNIKGLLFSRQHLIAWIVKEMNSYRDFPMDDITKEQEYRMLKAYFMLVDEFNLTRDTLGKELKEKYKVSGDKYSVLWPESVTQLELAEQANIAFEIFKVQCFGIYVKKIHRQYLKEYLNVSIRFGASL